MKIIAYFAVLLLSFSAIAQSNNCNCCTEKHEEFDFWMGSWETYNPDGTLAGTNEIDKIQGKCVLRENWTSSKAGYTGTSYNFYNYQEKQWEQIWVDNQGQSLHLKGNRKGNQMILLSEVLQDKDGVDLWHRVTWTNNDDGTVRQLWESTNDGQSWTVAFDGLYKKKK